MRAASSPRKGAEFVQTSQLQELLSEAGIELKVVQVFTGNASVEDESLKLSLTLFVDSLKAPEKLSLEEDIKVNDADAKIWPKLGFHKGTHAEFLIFYSRWDFDQDYDLWDFSIGKVDVKIGEPSHLFRLVFLDIVDDDFFSGWESLHTVSLEGVSLTEVERYLEQAEFFIAKHRPSNYIHDVPHIAAFVGEDDSYRPDEPQDVLMNHNRVPAARFPEAISFFNAGMKTEPEEVAFLYYYKVLEHFFVINRSSEVKALVRSLQKDLDQLVEELVKLVYKTDEIHSLKHVVASVPGVATQVKRANSLGLISGTTLDDLANGLYKFRNSVAHGRKEQGLQLTVPALLPNQNVLGWIDISRDLALKSIEKFCY